MLGLVLTAGGARGAYQAGVLKRLGELRSLRGRPSPFAVIAGASAGAINGTLLAARGARFGEATAEIARVWSNLRVEDVFASDLGSLARTGASLARDFVLGSVLGHTRTHGLLDTSPLAGLLERLFPPRGIAEALRRGHLHAVAVTATSYHSGRSFTFVEGRPGHAVWAKSRRLVLPVSLTSRHVLASCAIPIVFPPVHIDARSGRPARAGAGRISSESRPAQRAPARLGLAGGERSGWFGDGGLRLVAPLSPAIRLGATHILSVGVRSSRAAESLAREEVGAASAPPDDAPRLPCPPLAQVTGVFLNAIFLDHLDADLDHLARMNEIVASGKSGAGASEPIRRVTPLALAPSEDLALVAKRFAHRMPRVVRFLLEGLGTPDAQSADLMSYLLFDAAYTRALVEIGYADAGRLCSEIEALIHEAPPPRPAPQRDGGVAPTPRRSLGLGAATT
jgi:NTE family protein